MLPASYLHVVGWKQRPILFQNYGKCCGPRTNTYTHTHPSTHTDTYTNTPAQSNPSASVSGHGPNHSNATEDSTEASASLGLCSWSEQPCVLVLVMSLETDETAELLERPLSTRHSNFFCKTGPWRSDEQLNRSSFEMAKLDFCFDVSFGLRYLEKTCPCQVFFSWP